MSAMLNRLGAHKLMIGLTIAIIAGGGYGIYRATRPPVEDAVQYITAPVVKDLLIVSVGASGQVLTQDQLEIKPSVSGKIGDVRVKEGDVVQQGQVIAEIDRTEALKTVRDATQSVRDAQNSLTSARLSLAKLKEPTDAATLLQAQNALNQAKRDLEALMEPADPLDIQSAQADLVKAEYDLRFSADGVTPQMIRDEYDELVPLLNSTLLFLQNTLIDADNILGIDNQAANIKYQSQLSSFNRGYRQKAESDYAVAKQAVSATQVLMATVQPRNENILLLSRVVDASRTALSAMSVLLKDVREALLHTPPSPTFSQSEIDGLRSGIQSSLSSIDTKITSFVTQEQAVEQAKASYASSRISLQKMQIALDKLKQGPEPRDIEAAKERIKEREQALVDIKAGTDATDILLSQNTVDQRLAALVSAQGKLADAQKALIDYSVLSPFEGIIVTVPVRKGDSASPSTVLANLATKQKLAQISLNEVDVTKVSIGQKATLRFDAIEDLMIVGTVFQVDQEGTVSQGVVTYSVKIGLDTADDRVRSGMSATASIIVHSTSDAILVPNAAVKQQNNQSYVDVLAEGSKTSIRKNVEIGLANDTMTEILSGLTIGENVVTQTIARAAQAVQAPATSLRLPGLGGIGGGGGAGGGATFRTGGGGGAGVPLR